MPIRGTSTHFCIKLGLSLSLDIPDVELGNVCERDVESQFELQPVDLNVVHAKDKSKADVVGKFEKLGLGECGETVLVFIWNILVSGHGGAIITVADIPEKQLPGFHFTQLDNGK